MEDIYQWPMNQGGKHMNEATLRKVLENYLADKLIDQIMADIAELEDGKQLQVSLETTITIGR